jgi:hypothetical protein
MRERLFQAVLLELGPRTDGTSRNALTSRSGASRTVFPYPLRHDPIPCQATGLDMILSSQPPFPEQSPKQQGRWALMWFCGVAVVVYTTGMIAT